VGKYSQKILYPRWLAEFTADFLAYIQDHGELPSMGADEGMVLGRCIEELERKVGLRDNIHWGPLRDASID